ncbi:MAG: YajQ family cyclic di-GMP-binding protein [Gammaproteobacteria bacterium]
MPSFDVVSEIDKHELSNAVDQAVRELAQRFDFKGSKARIEHEDKLITLVAESEFQTRQILDILHAKFAKRGLDINCLELGELTSNVAETRQPVTVREGIDKDLARKLVKMVKDSKLKVQAQMQQDQVRVTGKSRDDLQKIISLLREAEVDYPLQFTNFRD